MSPGNVVNIINFLLDVLEVKKSHFCNFISITHPSNHTVVTYCWQLLLTQTHSACHVERLTAQHIYCTNMVQTVQCANELYLQ